MCDVSMVVYFLYGWSTERSKDEKTIAGGNNVLEGRDMEGLSMFV